MGRNKDFLAVPCACKTVHIVEHVMEIALLVGVAEVKHLLVGHFVKILFHLFEEVNVNDDDFHAFEFFSG